MAISENSKLAFDGLSVSTVVAALAGWLPVIAALASLVWTLIRIYETKTVQEFLLKRRKKKATRDHARGVFRAA